MRPPAIVPMLLLLALAACGGGEAPPPGEDGVPNISYCDQAAEWEEAWSEHEWEVLALLNERRAKGAECGGAGAFESAEPLAMHPALRCAARIHSLDMSEQEYFDHVNPDGDRPIDRMASAGYDARTAGESLAWGQSDPTEVLTEWLGSEQSCADAMAADFVDVGVGYFPDRGPYWTIVFGAP